MGFQKLADIAFCLCCTIFLPFFLHLLQLTFLYFFAIPMAIFPFRSLVLLFLPNMVFHYIMSLKSIFPIKKRRPFSPKAEKNSRLAYQIIRLNTKYQTIIYFVPSGKPILSASAPLFIPFSFAVSSTEAR